MQAIKESLKWPNKKLQPKRNTASLFS